MSKVVRRYFRLIVLLLAAVLVVPLSSQAAYASESVGTVNTGINKQVIKAEDSSPTSGDAQKSDDVVNSEAKPESSQPSDNAENQEQNETDSEPSTMERSSVAANGPTILCLGCSGTVNGATMLEPCNWDWRTTIPNVLISLPTAGLVRKLRQL